MNRKKIALLLTGLMITSTTFMGCTNNNKTSDNNSSRIAQEQRDDSILKRASERTVTEYNQDNTTRQYPDVAYADDLGNVEDNQFNNNNGNLDGSRSNTITNGDYEMTPSNDTNQNNAFNNGNITSDSTNGFNGINGNNGIMPNSEDNNGGNYNFESPLSDDSTQNYNFGSTSSNENTNEFRGFSNATDDNYETGFNDGTNFQNNGTQNNGQTETNLWNDSNNSNYSSTTQNGQTTPNTNGMNNNINSSNSNNSSINNSTSDSTLGMDTNENTTNTFDSGNGLNTGNDLNSKMNPATPYAVVDQSKVAGNINVVRTRGSSEMTSTGSSGNTTLVPQGTVEISFKLSGDVLNAKYTDGSNSTALSSLLQSAYEETRQDANTGYSGTPTTTTARENLRKGLAEIFEPSNDSIKLVFKSSNGAVSTIPFTAEEMFPDTTKSPNYNRYIIDLEGTSGQYRGGVRTSRSTNASDIVVRMLVRVETPSDTVGLKTNTEYSFVGTENDANFKVTPPDDQKTDKEQLIGFNVPSFTTAKTPSKITATDKMNKSVIYEAENDSTAGTQNSNFYLSQTTDKTYIDMKKLQEPDTGQESKIQPMGTTIKFTNLIFNDTDKTITNIEMQDDRNVKHKCVLTSVDSNDESKGSYLEVTGLTRNTPYVFTKLLVTSKVGSNSETKTIHFANFDSTNSKLEVNKERLSTTAFAEPQLKLAAEATADSTLPSGLKIPTVKNDINSLRYVLKVGNPEGFVGDVRVNGLKSNENSKVEKIVDTKAKINYYVVTLYNLTKDTDYGFIILETDYKDPEGRALVGRQAINTINEVSTPTDNTTTDNKTESNALTGTNAFNVLVNESVKVTNARRADVPIFIDDMNGRFLRLEFTPPQENATAEVEYVDNNLRFTNLKPDSSTVCKVDFVYSGENSTEQKISKYVRVTTPKVEDLDIKSIDIAVGKDNNVNIKFELYSEEKSPVKTVKVTDIGDKEITSTWDKATRTLTLQNLAENTEYDKLKVVFTLENNKKVEYTLDTFTTGTAEVKPTGAIADFVSRVYKIALGREPEVEGWNFWINKLQSKELNATEFIAENLMTQPEFVDRELSKRNFVMTMYSLIVNRESDDEGRAYWERKYDEYRAQTTSIEKLRIRIAREMMDQQEFKDLINKLNLRY